MAKAASANPPKPPTAAGGWSQRPPWYRDALPRSQVAFNARLSHTDGTSIHVASEYSAEALAHLTRKSPQSQDVRHSKPSRNCGPHKAQSLGMKHLLRPKRGPFVRLAAAEFAKADKKTSGLRQECGSGPTYNKRQADIRAPERLHAEEQCRDAYHLML